MVCHIRLCHMCTILLDGDQSDCKRMEISSKEMLTFWLVLHNYVFLDLRYYLGFVLFDLFFLKIFFFWKKKLNLSDKKLLVCENVWNKHISSRLILSKFMLSKMYKSKEVELNRALILICNFLFYLYDTFLICCFSAFLSM